MREIKFRGWNAKNNRWIYGYYFANRGAHFISPDEFVNPIASADDYEVEADTIGQFTGLKDKNGKEIYEGDIIEELLSSGEPVRHVVSWSDEDACFTATLLPIEKDYNLVCRIFQEWVSSKYVVGNIIR